MSFPSLRLAVEKREKHHVSDYFEWKRVVTMGTMIYPPFLDKISDRGTSPPTDLWSPDGYGSLIKVVENDNVMGAISLKEIEKINNAQYRRNVVYFNGSKNVVVNPDMKNFTCLTLEEFWKRVELIRQMENPKNAVDFFEVALAVMDHLKSKSIETRSFMFTDSAYMHFRDFL